MSANITRIFFERRISEDSLWKDATVVGFIRYGGRFTDILRQAREHAQLLADAWQQEVRWHIEGSSQGHYASPQPLPKLEEL